MAAIAPGQERHEPVIIQTETLPHRGACLAVQRCERFGLGGFPPRGNDRADKRQHQDAVPGEAIRRRVVEHGVGQYDAGARQGKAVPCRASVPTGVLVGHAAHRRTAIGSRRRCFNP